MNPSEHLTRNQIAAFSAGSLAVGEKHTVGGHLIRCVECRSLLPFPSRAQVWTAVTTEGDVGEIQKRDNSQLPDRTYSQWFVRLFGHRLAWAGGVLLLAFSLAGLLIMNVSNGGNAENEVARTFELENPIPAPNGNQATKMNAVIPSVLGSDSAVNEPNSTATDRGPRGIRRKSTGPIRSTANQPTNTANRNISTTRGAIIPCTVGRTIEVELASSKTDLVLRWKPVPKAAKYHLYVSDDNEILVDEFETDEETSYVLNKQLDPTRTYKWKIVITLESGQKLYVDAQKFTAKDFQSSLSGYKRKARSNTRCLANE